MILISVIFLTGESDPWPGVAIFLQNALIFFRQVRALVMSIMTHRDTQWPNN